ncbi:MAG TPA: hypothetical protein VJA66_12435 [Thermoanaerobaculia bacterium]
MTAADDELARRIADSGARRVAFLGLAKNVGKTTALVSVLSRFHERLLPVGATSAGRDGEEFDAITGDRKPRFRLWPGQLVASAESTFGGDDGSFELVRALPFATRFGPIQVRRVRSDSEIEVMGPTTSSQLSAAAAALEQSGSRLVLIDGAFGRRAFASARVCDGIVLSVGLAAAASLEGAMFAARSAIALLDLKEPLPGAKTRRFEGAVTEADLSANPPAEGETVLAEDFAAIFLSPEVRRDLHRRGIALAVSRPARLIAVTSNPTAPGRNPASAREFFDALAAVLPDVALLDLKANLCRLP